MENEPTDRRFAEINVLNQIATLMASNSDPRESVLPALRLLEELMDMQFTTLTLVDNDSGEVVIDLASDLTSEQTDQVRYRLGEGITGRVAATGKPAVIPSIAESQEFLNRTNRNRSLDTSFICVPVVIGQQVLGTLSMDGRSKPKDALWADASLLGVVAAMLAQAIRMRRDARENQSSLAKENRQLLRRLKGSLAPGNIVGKSREMRIVFDQIAQATSSRSTVLINGETGTGKELVAEALHYNGSRSDQPFIRVNCAALPESLIESELFGHEKGAFTGAVAMRHGRFEQADGGTIFLDEIGDISQFMQVKLLRVLQEREFERVGGRETLKVDVRVIAATHQDLFAMTREGRFRSDLFYRINVFPIYLLPLRKRQSDIPLLAEFFLEKYAASAGKNITSIAPEAMAVLTRHQWPGNVRELENCIEHAVILATDSVIRVEHLPASLRLPPDESGGHLDFKTMVENYERSLIVEAFKTTRGNVRQAAQLLGSTQRIISYRSKQLRIDPLTFTNL
ncbi:MAG: sigma 54-interacting transcriptional regulator [Planctomycetota bacterium]|jgi:Nif-specific regulatory protein|nr:sigma 54-interacting transcriptional regulator [Planctomycetota bacterium]